MIRRNASQTDSHRQRAYTELKERIIFGRYKPGAVLNEKEICEGLGISRTPYREALIKLELDDLVVIKPKVGVVVSHIDLPSLKDVVELRTILEGVAAQLAFKRIQAHHIETLRKVVEEIDALSPQDDIYTYLTLDARFHQVIHEAQGNQVLLGVLEKLYNQCMRLWNSIENQDFMKDLIKSSIRDVKRVYEAFLAKDPEAVEKLVKEHFTAYLHTLITHLVGGLGNDFAPRTK